MYAFFVVAGQFFVFGLNDSVLKHSAEYRENKSENTDIFVTATTLALFLQQSVVQQYIFLHRI